MNKDLKKKSKNDFKNYFFKLIKNAVFRKTIMLYHATKFFTETLLAIEMRKKQILMNKIFYLGISI